VRNLRQVRHARKARKIRKVRLVILVRQVRQGRQVRLVRQVSKFFQVESREDTSLRGKPSAVVQYNAWKGGGIIAVNYEARAAGVTR
jgi:hypothetical protein